MKKFVAITFVSLVLLGACSKQSETGETQPEPGKTQSEPASVDSTDDGIKTEQSQTTAPAVPPEETTPSLDSSLSLMQGVDKSDPGWKQKLVQPEIMDFESGKNYYWDIQTNKGDMSFRLFHETAPMHASSTIYLSKIGFYDEVIFHRVIPGFMAQGGDPTGTGSGGPGYKYAGEFDNKNSHDRAGLLSMANAGPNTDGSQFFITFVPTPFLDGKHTIFGELLAGKETLSSLEEKGSRSGRTSELLQINKTTIRVE